LGDTILDNPSDDDSVEEREIEEIFVHPKYVKGRAYFDVALLKVADLEFGIYIRPGFNFTNVLHTAFMLVGPESVKRYLRLNSIFLRFWDLHVLKLYVKC